MSNEQHSPERWRILVVTAVFVSCLGLVAVVFWREDLRYTLPTPRPANLQQIALGTANPQATRGILGELGIDMPFVLDVDGLIARDSGIYATPQALLLDGADRIVYRGNYNTARYCTDTRTEFVRIAIEALLSKVAVSVPEMPAYGCELPSYGIRSRQRSALVRALP